MTKPKYNCGDRASTIIGAIEGIITAMTIRGSNITYEFSTVVRGDQSNRCHIHWLKWSW